MANFAAWDRTTLEQFAREATAKLIENKEAIEELVGALKYYMTDFTCHEPSLSIMCRKCDELIAKHDLTTKEQA